MREHPFILVFAYHNVGYACLDALIAAGENVIGVFTHEPDATEEIWFKSVAALARHHHIPVYTPASPNTPVWKARIREMAPDILFSFYYRNIVSEEILAIPHLGAYNMHGSLLPKYRGRVPVNWAIINGEKMTGVTLHHMVKRADAGDIVDQEPVAIGPDDIALDVFNKITAASRKVLERQLVAIKAGTAPRIPQDDSQATTFGGRKAEDGRIDWAAGADRIYDLIRAVTHPYPGAFTEVNGKRLFIWQAKPLGRGEGRPGMVLSIDPLRVATGSGSLEITRYQWEGDHEEAATDVTHDLRAGVVLGRTSK